MKGRRHELILPHGAGPGADQAFRGDIAILKNLQYGEQLAAPEHLAAAFVYLQQERSVPAIDHLVAELHRDDGARVLEPTREGLILTADDLERMRAANDRFAAALGWLPRSVRLRFAGTIGRVAASFVPRERAAIRQLLQNAFEGARP